MHCNYGLFRDLKMLESASRLPRSARDWRESNLALIDPSSPLREGIERLFLFLR
jgi:hypothetical protein